MSDDMEQERKELLEKIFAKRQQIEFEKNEIESDSELSAENRENPDVSEEFKNFDDPAENAVDKKRISAKERHEIMEAYEEGLRGYTYFES